MMGENNEPAQPSENEPAEPRASWHEYNIDTYEACYAPRKSEKQNGLYVWLAIAESRAAKIPIPDWCVDYLYSAASQIFWTYHRTLLTKPASDAEGPDLTISDADATRRVAEHLKLSHDGWNAFRQARADRDKIEDAGQCMTADAHAGTVTEDLINHEKVFEMIRKRRGLAETFDDRQPQRRIKDGKKLLPKMFWKWNFPAKPKPR